MFGPTLKLLEHFNCHEFIIKKQFRPKTCPVCFKKVKLSLKVVRCHNCNLHCHPRCWKEVPHICRGSGLQDPRKLLQPDDSFQSTRTSHSHSHSRKTQLFIPYHILRLVNEIELQIQPGLYCLPSRDKKQVVENIIMKFKQGKVQNLKVYSVHTLAACLKYFLINQLPIIPIWHITKKGDDLEIQFDALTKPSRQILGFLVLHLKTVAANPTSRMNLLMLAQNFTPALLKRTNESSVRALFKLFDKEPNFFMDHLRTTKN